MSALKNKFDLDKREQNKSVVQRFITEQAPDIQNNEQNNEESAGTDDSARPQSEEKKIFVPIMPAPAEPQESFRNDAAAISAQLERLESRLEQFESKVGELDKLGKLDKLDEISSLKKLDKLDKLDELTNLEQLDKLDKLNEITSLNQPKYILFNAMEEAVREEVRATMNNANVCRCDKCYNDICAVVLNNSPPQYVTTQEGGLLKKASALLSIEALTKLSGEIFNAINKVRNNPGH